MRSLHPEMELLYLPELGVRDQSEKPAVREQGSFGRRRRMMIGNVQWMREPAWRGSRVVRTLAMRRVFRVFWAYWSLLLGAGIMLALIEASSGIAQMGTIAGAAIIVAIPFGYSRSQVVLRIVRTLGDAALASLLAPFYLFAPRNEERALWR
jgi:hypothetical protein